MTRRTLSALLLAPHAVFGADLDTAKIDELTGLKGQLNEKEAVYKVTFPRGDVVVGGFFHYWGRGKAADLARGVKAGL